MNEYGEATGKDTVRIERLLPGPIERVWSYLTESEKRGKWLAAGEMELRVGGNVQLQFLHASLTPAPGADPRTVQKHGVRGRLRGDGHPM